MSLVRSGCRPFYPLDDHSIKKIAARVTPLRRRNESPRRLAAAELGGETLDLAASFLKGTGAVDFFSCQKEFFLDRELGADAAAGFGLAEAAREQPLKLLFRMAPGHHQAVQLLVNAGFDQQGGFDENRVANSGAPPHLKLAEDDFRDPGMDDGVKAVEFGAVGKDDGAELCALHAATRGEHGLAEVVHDFVVGRLAGLDQFVGQGGRVGDRKAHLAQHGGDGAFAAGDSTGESQSQHDGELSRAGGRLRCGKFGRGAAEARGLHGVAHEHGDGHGANAAGDRCERSGGVDGVGMDVANEGAALGAEYFEAARKVLKKALGLFGVRNAVGADVDDRGAGPPTRRRLDPVRFHVGGFAHGGDDDIGAADDAGKVARFGMANRHGGVGVHQEQSHGFADNVAAAEDYGVGAFDFYFVAAQNFHAAGGSAGHQAGASAHKAAKINGMEAVHVFGGINGFQDALGIHLRRKRELDKNTVNIVVAIEVFDDGEQIKSADCGGRCEQRAGDAEMFASRDFAFHVELRGGIFAYKDGSKSGANTSRCEQPDFITQLGEDLVADFVPVK